jgi:predicted transposase YbfD/YdcC
MALGECNTLASYLRMIPDPRGKQGQQYAWWHLLGIVCWAILCGQKVVRGMAEWAQAHQALILDMWGGELPRLPSESTLRRALRYVDVTQLEAHLAEFGQELAALASSSPVSESDEWEGQAVDGKEVRGANTHGAKLHVVSLVQQQSGVILSQHPVPAKTNEIKAVPALLQGRDLQHVVITGDALLTQRALAQQILDQGGHYLMVAKGNQPELYDDIETLFAEADWGEGDDRQSYTSHSQGHGRYETRTLTTSEQLQGYLDWPGAQQVAQRLCTRQRHPFAASHTAISYAVTSLSRQQATPQQLESLWRGHWSIENRNHYVRDETLGEDRCQVFAGHAAAALAALRSAILTLLRSQTWRCVPQALRHYAAHPRQAFAIIGIPFS